MPEFNVDQLLQDFLQERDKGLGIGGNSSFEIRVLLEDNPIILRIPNITEETAKKLFDLFDENNAYRSTPKHCQISIHQFKKEEEIDLNYIPNIHTKFL